MPRYAPRKLSTSKFSPFFDKAACQSIDKVFCDGVLVPFCVYYDMDAGRARGKTAIKGTWLPEVKGKITVTLKEGERW
jgi:hypothetical protein